MTSLTVGLITLFIYGVYDISGFKSFLTDKISNDFFYKLINCFFCTSFWISVIITGIALEVDSNTDILTPIYFSGFLYLIIKIRWK